MMILAILGVVGSIIYINNASQLQSNNEEKVTGDFQSFDKIDCQSISSASPSYADNMDKLALAAKLKDGYWSRYDEGVVSSLCKNGGVDTKSINTAVDYGAVEARNAEIFAKILGKEYKAPQRSADGLLFEKIDNWLLGQNFCSACAGNIATAYVKERHGRTANLVDMAMSDDAAALQKLRNIDYNSLSLSPIITKFLNTKWGVGGCDGSVPNIWLPHREIAFELIALPIESYSTETQNDKTFVSVHYPSGVVFRLMVVGDSYMPSEELYQEIPVRYPSSAKPFVNCGLLTDIEFEKLSQISPQDKKPNTAQAGMETAIIFKDVDAINKFLDLGVKPADCRPSQQDSKCFTFMDFAESNLTYSSQEDAIDNRRIYKMLYDYVDIKERKSDGVHVIGVSFNCPTHRNGARQYFGQGLSPTPKEARQNAERACNMTGGHAKNMRVYFKGEDVSDAGETFVIDR